jgi:hypothetical protein
MGNTSEKIPTCNCLNAETIKTNDPKSVGELQLDLDTIGKHGMIGGPNVDHNEDIFRRNSSRRSSYVLRPSES